MMESEILKYLLENIPVVVFMGIALYIQRKDNKRANERLQKIIGKKDEIILEHHRDVEKLSKDVIEVAVNWTLLSKDNKRDHAKIQEDLTKIKAKLS